MGTKLQRLAEEMRAKLASIDTEVEAGRMTPRSAVTDAWSLGIDYVRRADEIVSGERPEPGVMYASRLDVTKPRNDEDRRDAKAIAALDMALLHGAEARRRAGR